ncbi:nicotinamide riboside kinase 1 isoform X1 [Osmia bicornis bicornis]|uniref:nicotinamide riboside kinase 1 isoform X1 n=1 Tax=Osmia bicornis bicornis TaxID=1437191 RepID=UPI0010F747AB|nr:nicotinamide riboside kinase 1 isoform X1 [Osmia bicornis bicornis]
MSSKKWLVIGITGATCSGKTTLANRLQKELKNSIIVHQDNYFWPIDDPRHVKIPKLNHLNWELMSSMDMDKMRSDILKLIEFSPNDVNSIEKNCERVLIIDGYLLFKCKVITNLCDIKYFFTVPKEISKERREKREYEPRDVPGYFEEYVWPEYLKYKDEIMKDKNLCKTITFIDGSKDSEEIFQMIFPRIKQMLS